MNKKLLNQIPTIDAIYGYDEAPNNFDYHCSVMTLPLVMKTTLEAIPFQDKPYLKADQAIVEFWKNKLAREAKIRRMMPIIKNFPIKLKSFLVVVAIVAKVKNIAAVPPAARPTI